MNVSLTRRQWLLAAPATALTAVAATSLAQDADDTSARANPSNDSAVTTSPGNPRVHAEFPSHDPAVVREVVGVSHFNLDRVRELVEARPALAKATWDWGFGDWESALGAASHTGRREIAELLIEHGARPNIFTFAMLGKLEVVRAAVEASPGVQRIPGPHGITLLRHAQAGGEPARPVVEYLESLGDADVGPMALELADEQKQRYIGKYNFGDGPDDILEVLIDRRNNLAIRRGDRAARILNRVEEHAFAPVGAPAVRVRFRIDSGRAESVTIHDPHPIVTAIRTA